MLDWPCVHFPNHHSHCLLSPSPPLHFMFCWCPWCVHIGVFVFFVGHFASDEDSARIESSGPFSNPLYKILSDSIVENTPNKHVSTIDVHVSDHFFWYFFFCHFGFVDPSQLIYNSISTIHKLNLEEKGHISTTITMKEVLTSGASDFLTAGGEYVGGEDVGGEDGVAWRDGRGCGILGRLTFPLSASCTASDMASFINCIPFPTSSLTAVLITAFSSFLFLMKLQYNI